MSDFRPYSGMILPIGSTFFGFLPHPYFSDDEQEVFVVEGGEAFLYKVQNLAKRSYCALKVLKASYRSPYVAEISLALARLKHVPGFYLGRRACLTRQQYPELIRRFPDLEYAVLMPWFEGKSWSGFMLDRESSASYTRAHALKLASMMAHILWQLEAHGLAHADIAGSNILMSPQMDSIELLDMENMYMHGAASMPPKYSHGSPGYQHRALDQRGQWRPDGDRFAGAILLTEILVWSDPQIREQTPEGSETLFHPQEIQEETHRVQNIRKALWAISPTLLQLFNQAWISRDLASCPDFWAWVTGLASVFA